MVIADKPNDPWFVAADVCKVLGHTNTTTALRNLDEDERAKFNLGGGRRANIVSESGLYKLIMQSRKPEAKVFQDWVTRDVLPAIRKNGGYVQGQEGLV